MELEEGQSGVKSSLMKILNLSMRFSACLWLMQAQTQMEVNSSLQLPKHHGLTVAT
jgi:hypothetical protein